MPRLANRNAGIKTIGPGNYQARVFHNRKEESKNFKRLDDAQRWQRNLKADLERCPQDIQRSKRKWVGTLVIPTGVISKEFEALNDAIKWVDQGKVQVSLKAGVREISAISSTFLPTGTQVKIIAQHGEGCFLVEKFK